MEDVDKLDNIRDGFIHYQLIRFCQAIRLQDLNGHVQLANQHVVQQQHVDHKIANALLKKGTRDAYKAWNQQDWVDMRRHALARVARRGQIRSPQQHHHKERCVVRQMPGLLPSWAPCPPCSEGLTAGQRPPGSLHLGCPPPFALKRLHEDLLQQHDCTDQPAAALPAPPSGAGGGAAANAGANPQP